MTQLAEEQSSAAAHYLRLSAQSSNGGPSWLDELRRQGIARFDQVGFPNTKQEEWRFTNVAPIARTAFQPGELAPADQAVEFSFGNDAACELVFVNGHFSGQLSKLGKLPRGVMVRSLTEALEINGPEIR